MPNFEEARTAEVEYHRELYKKFQLHDQGSGWLSLPARYALNALELMQPDRGARALDLGCGVGRHTIPIARHLGEGSMVTAVDLLPEAINELATYAEKSGVADRITGVVADAEHFSLEDECYDGIFSISCIEHVQSVPILEGLIRDLQGHTRRPAGMHCFMMMTNNVWKSKKGEQKSPKLEQNLSYDMTEAMLRHLYEGWNIRDLSGKEWKAVQQLDGEDGTLASTCLRFTATVS